MCPAIDNYIHRHPYMQQTTQQHHSTTLSFSLFSLDPSRQLQIAQHTHTHTHRGIGTHQFSAGTSWLLAATTSSILFLLFFHLQGVRNQLFLVGYGQHSFSFCSCPLPYSFFSLCLSWSNQIILSFSVCQLPVCVNVALLQLASLPICL